MMMQVLADQAGHKAQRKVFSWRSTYNNDETMAEGVD